MQIKTISYYKKFKLNLRWIHYKKSLPACLEFQRRAYRTDHMQGQNLSLAYRQLLDS